MTLSGGCAFRWRVTLTVVVLACVLLVSQSCCSLEHPGSLGEGEVASVRTNSQIKLILHSDKVEYDSGMRPRFTLTIANVSTQNVYVLGCLLGSDSCGWRYPRFDAAATCNGAPVEVRDVPPVVNGPLIVPFHGGEPLKRSDFVLLKPGDAFDPFDTRKGYFSHWFLEHAFAFDRPGRYRVKIGYDTDTNEDKKFFLRDYLASDDRTYVPGNDASLLPKLLRIRVWSNEVEFTVK